MPFPPSPFDGDRDDAPRPVHRANALVFETARGRVVQCPCCDALELRFGNALLSVPAAELALVRTTLAEAERNAEREQEAGEQAGPARVALTLNESGCGWIFDADELAELHRLIAGAELMLELGLGPIRPDAPDARPSRDAASDLPPAA